MPNQNKQEKNTSKKNKKVAIPTKRDKDDTLTIDLKRERKAYSFLIQKIKREFDHHTDVAQPKHLKPMLATAITEPFDDVNWQFEIKWDGYRCLAYTQNGKVELRSRNQLSFNKKYATVHDTLSAWPVNAVIDGEIVVVNDDGYSMFNGLEQWNRNQQGTLLYYVFDLLWLEGIDLMNEPLFKRREILKKVLPDEGIIRYSDHIDVHGADFFKVAKENGLEGIIAKDKRAPYEVGNRSTKWCKIKVENRHEAIITGYTKKTKSKKLFSSLILGVYENDRLKYIGQVGTGFTDTLQEDLLKKMAPLMRKSSPFQEQPNINAATVWLEPQLVCEVKYTELTREGVMRHPSFQGLRTDKKIKEVTADKPIQPDLLNRKEKNANTVNEELDKKNLASKFPYLKLTNLNKIYWKSEGYTKGDVIHYYDTMAPYILPYLLHRPHSLNRHPNGIDGENFYQKNMAGKEEAWMTTFKRFSASSGESSRYIVCENETALIYMANLGCIEMNPWHSTVQHPELPDWCVIDLDPDGNAFEEVIEVARVVKEILDALHIPSYPKTSGSTGMHIYVPLGKKFSFDQAKQLAELLATLAHQQLPSITSLERNPQKRKGLIYLDYLQNRPVQTICAPYSLRPKKEATVSMPLHWTEVKEGLKMNDFTIRNALSRVKETGDLFGPVLGKGIKLENILKKVQTLV